MRKRLNIPYWVFCWMGFFLLLGCEEDDICFENQTTPNLIMVFKNITNQDNLSVSQISIQYEGNEVINVSNTDSISFPLPLESRENMVITLQKDNTTITDEINLSFQTQEVFISKACGFKVDYSNISLNSFSENEVEDVQLLNQEIRDESAASIYVFYND